MKQGIIKAAADKIDTVRRYLPSNYIAFTWGNDIVIQGEDVAGWTIEGYVRPRLLTGGFSVSVSKYNEV